MLSMHCLTRVPRKAVGCALLVTLSILGCSGDGLKRAAVSGKVLVDKVPLEEGAINFFPIEGTEGPSVGGKVVNGDYHIPRSQGVIVGKNRVEIYGFKKSGRKVPDVFDKNILVEERIDAVPADYNRKSTLVREIRDGDNTVDFDLTGFKPKK
jgi:hypothetical protein